MDNLISREFIKRLGGECIARRDRETGELIAITGIDLLPSAVPDTVKDLVTIFQNSKDMKLIARDGDLRADRIVLGRMPFEWIPCSERLPEDEHKTYWVCTDTGYQCECRWTNVNPIWTDLTTDWHWNIFDTPQYTKVVAWMTLPEPYEEK